MKKLILLLSCLFTVLAFGSSTRIITVDQFKSSDLTKTWNPPATSTTLIGTNTTDTLTNKSISGATNTFSAIPGSVLNNTSVDLTTKVTGILPIANGGTGSSTASGSFDALSPTTTKGDLIVHDATTNIREAVGADGFVLTADSTQASGIKWAAPSGANSWSLTGNAGTTPGTNFIGTTDAQNFEIHTNGLTQNIYDQTGGWAANQSNVPTDGVGKTQYSHVTTVDPGVDTTTANNTGFYNALNYDQAATNFNYGGNLVASSNQYSHNGAGTVNYASIMDNSANFAGVAGTTSLFKGNNLSVNIGTGYTITSYNGVNSYLGATGSIFDNASLYNSNGQFTDVTAVNLYTDSHNIGANGTSVISGNMMNYSANVNLADSASVQNVYSAALGVSLANTSTVQNATGENVNMQFTDTTTVTGNINGTSVGIDVRDGAGVQGLSGENINVQVRNTATATNVTGSNIGVNVDNTAALSSLTGINVNPHISGSSTVGNVTVGGIYGNVDGGTITNYSGLQVSPVLQGTAAATNFTGMSVNPQIQGTATLTNGLTALQVNANTVPAVTSVQGITVDVSGANVTDPFAKVAISGNGGSASFNYNPTIPGATTFFQINYMGGGPTIASGDPTGAYGFGNNLAHSVNFQDDWTPDVTTLRLGFIDVGFVGSIVGTAGKTMDSWTGALGGFGNPSGAGTIDQAIMFRAAGGLAQGGTLAVNNMYAFYGMSSLCGIATNCWNLYDDSGTGENYLGRLAIGSASKKVTNSSTALEIGNSKAFLNGSGNTATRNALTAVAGMQFYNTTSNKLQYYNGASWVDTSAGGSGTETQEVPTGAVDSSNVTFTLAHTPTSDASVKLYVDGTFARQGVDYTISGVTITMTTAPLFNQSLDANYTY